MKKSIKLIVLALTFLTPLGSIAQNSEQQLQRIGHLNVNELLASMPKVINIQKELQTYGADLEKQMKIMTEEFQRKLQEYQAGAETMSNSVRKDRERELTQLQDRIERFQQEAQDEVNKKEHSLFEPVLKEVREAIDSVAKDRNLTYVFDTSSGIVLYAAESENVLPMVKTKLGVN